MQHNQFNITQRDGVWTIYQYTTRFPGRVSSRRMVRVSYMPVLSSSESFPEFLRRWAGLLDVSGETLEALHAARGRGPLGGHGGDV